MLENIDHRNFESIPVFSPVLIFIVGAGGVGAAGVESLNGGETEEESVMVLSYFWHFSWADIKLTMRNFLKSIAYKRQAGEKKADVSRLLFFLSWLFGVAVTLLNIFIEPKFTPQGLVVYAVSDATFNFLIFFISTFTVNYLGRRATDAWQFTRPGSASGGDPSAPISVMPERPTSVVKPEGAGLSNVSNLHQTTRVE